MRKALIVGIDYYKNISRLYGCVNDSYSIKTVLDRHSDGTINFGTRIETATDETNQISRKDLKICVQELFADDSEIALFYFSGHGYIESTGGYLITSECTEGDDGFPMNELLQIANSSPSKNKIIILDCCHSGIAGNSAQSEDKAILKEGITILKLQCRAICNGRKWFRCFYNFICRCNEWKCGKFSWRYYTGNFTPILTNH